MICPEKIRELYLCELEHRRSENNFTRLIRRRGRLHDLAELDLTDAEQTEKLLSAWYRFHENAHHLEYRDLYSKILYCKAIQSHDLDPDTFLELIADRLFLFLEFNENSSTPEYPLLSQAVFAYDSVAPHYPQEKVEQVLDQAFIPTMGHLRTFHQWQRNLEELRMARQQRKAHIKWFAELSEPLAPFSVQITETDADPEEIDLQLDELFCAYEEACKSKAYVQWNASKANREKAHWRWAIRCTRQYLDQHPSSLPGHHALVFFHLFTQNAESMLGASLHLYQFKLQLKSKPALKAPDTYPAKQGERIRCNILLFDQLLELFLAREFPKTGGMLENERDGYEQQLEEYRNKAKFVFYRYSRYDRYWHYDLQSFWKYRSFNTKAGKPQIGFSYSENYKDGVDFWGNLLRFHINYCIPLQVQWLLPTLSLNRSETPESVLATLLLAEGALQIPARDRLINRVQQILSSTDGNDMIETYEQDLMDEDAVKSHLDEWCKRHQLRVPKEEASLYEPNEQNAAIQGAGRQILEYFLRDRLVQKARNALLKAAKAQFEELSYNEFYCDP